MRPHDLRRLHGRGHEMTAFTSNTAPMTEIKASLIALSDYVAGRTWARMQGLTDDEFSWTPVEDCWTAGAGDDGQFRLDGTHPAPEPAPFTTLAWRLHHLMGCYGADRNGLWLGLATTGDPLADPAVQPVDAAGALALLARCQTTWRGYLNEVSKATLGAPLGPTAGPFATATGVDFVLHQIDEQIHHGAELALLRDLYRAGVSA